MGGDRCELNRFAVGWSRRFTRATSPSWIRRAVSSRGRATRSSSRSGVQQQSRSRRCPSWRTGQRRGSGSRARSWHLRARCLAEVSRWTEVGVGDIRTAVDGCGVVCFGLPLRNMALAYARLAIADFGLPIADSKGVRPIRSPQSAIVESMLRHPELIAGEGRPCTEIMRAHPGRVIAKVGAEGVYCALLTQERLGIALKVADGHAVASALAMAAVLEELGLRPRPAGLTARPNVNTRGETVGELRVKGGLEQ